jgi:pyruvate/2-oxoglutarate/acetoin dehydrogenase E1 component
MAKLNMVKALNQALFQEMERDGDVLVLGEDVGVDGGVFRVTDDLQRTFGSQRVIDSPLAEAAIIGTAVGMALYGLKPVCEIQFSGFAFQCFHQIENHCARYRMRSQGRFHVPIVIRMPYGGGVRALEHHSESEEQFYAHIPGLKMVIPSGPRNARALLTAAIRDPDPVIFFEHKGLYGGRGGPAGEIVQVAPIPLGKGRVHREGTDVTIVSYLKTLEYSLAAAEQLVAEGISCEVFDPRTLVPLDRSGLRASLEKTGRLVVAHEAVTRGGFGAEIAAIAAEEFFDLLRAPVVRVGARNTPIPYAPELERHVLPGVERIADEVRKLVG